jgi:hypothetical protein
MTKIAVARLCRLIDAPMLIPSPRFDGGDIIGEPSLKADQKAPRNSCLAGTPALNLAPRPAEHSLRTLTPVGAERELK